MNSGTFFHKLKIGSGLAKISSITSVKISTERLNNKIKFIKPGSGREVSTEQYESTTKLCSTTKMISNRNIDGIKVTNLEFQMSHVNYAI